MHGSDRVTDNRGRMLARKVSNLIVMGKLRCGAPKFEIRTLTIQEVRRSLVAWGDIRNDVAFQNDVNSLLAGLERIEPPWRSLGANLPDTRDARRLATAA
jgi:hypothetical protein